MKALRASQVLLATAALVTACGGGKGIGGSVGGATGPNVQAVQVNLGPNASANIDYLNGIFTSVTICTPGSSSQCTTISNVLVDTGSYGLRLLASTLNGSSVSLPTQASGSGSLGECILFADNTYTWGPVVEADVHLGTSEVASSLPVNLIGTPSGSSFPSTPPSACSNPSNDSAGTPTEADTLASLGANGILGVGPFGPDCGSACATDASNGEYFSCTSSSCSEVAVAEASQVQNPVGYFATDNNGVVLELPSIPSGGQSVVNGSLLFGIGTQSNNGLGTALIIFANDVGEFSTTFNGSSFPESFIDSGSNTLAFTDSSIPTCPANELPDFYCPSSTLSLSATMVGTNNGSVTVPFAVANAVDLVNSGNAAYNDIAATSGALISSSFDWGLPFFYGLDVFVAMDGASTSGGTGPYYAF
jgi:hypothetical protein